MESGGEPSGSRTGPWLPLTGPENSRSRSGSSLRELPNRLRELPDPVRGLPGPVWEPPGSLRLPLRIA